MKPRHTLFFSSWCIPAKWNSMWIQMSEVRTCPSVCPMCSQWDCRDIPATRLPRVTGRTSFWTWTGCPPFIPAPAGRTTTSFITTTIIRASTRTWSRASCDAAAAKELPSPAESERRLELFHARSGGFCWKVEFRRGRDNSGSVMVMWVPLHAPGYATSSPALLQKTTHTRAWILLYSSASVCFS